MRNWNLNNDKMLSDKKKKIKKKEKKINEKMRNITEEGDKGKEHEIREEGEI